MKQTCNESPLSGFDHVGIHHRLILPPVSPEISGGHAKAVSAVGLKSEARISARAPLLVVTVSAVLRGRSAAGGCASGAIGAGA
jgi:hypothetical protein